ncbi:Calmodulin-binding transcription activator [Arachis hypogaea]|nr:Calmodulin-binding transcription activator [Arachis hypogaea]
MRFFRRDGHNWHKKKDERTVGEAHERLKVGTIEALNCYYAHGEQNPTFQRRSYWMLDLAYEHIILVHYRTTSEVKAKETKSKKVGMAINVDYGGVVVTVESLSSALETLKDGVLNEAET